MMELSNDIKVLLIIFCLLAELFKHIEEVYFQLKYRVFQKDGHNWKSLYFLNWVHSFETPSILYFILNVSYIPYFILVVSRF